MNTTTETKQSEPAKAPKPAPSPTAETKSIAIKKITFCDATSIPGQAAATTIRGDVTQANVARYTIEWLPAMRHVKVTYLAVNAAPQVVMVHETRVSAWEPMPL